MDISDITNYSVSTAVVVLIVFIYKMIRLKHDMRIEKEKQVEEAEENARKAIDSGDVDAIRDTAVRLREERED